MPGDTIRLHTLTLEELSGIVNLYPWFGAARMALCGRILKAGGDISTDRLSDASLHIASRSLLSARVRAAKQTDLSDANLPALLRSLLGDSEEKPKTRAVGGDFFSQEEYDRVKRDDDKVFTRFASKAKSQPEKEASDEILSGDSFCTEALARIYAEQGYPKQARQIYSRLSLLNPEKSAYFASLIGQIDNN